MFFGGVRLEVTCAASFAQTRDSETSEIQNRIIPRKPKLRRIVAAECRQLHGD